MSSFGWSRRHLPSLYGRFADARRTVVHVVSINSRHRLNGIKLTVLIVLLGTCIYSTMDSGNKAVAGIGDFGRYNTERVLDSLRTC